MLIVARNVRYSGVERTWVDALQMSVLTQSGHGGLSQRGFVSLRCLVLNLGEGNEAARQKRTPSESSAREQAQGPESADKPRITY